MQNGIMYNPENLSNVPTMLQSRLDEFEAAVESMFAAISQMNQPGVWGGDSYEAFKAKCDYIRSNQINPLIADLERWVSDTNRMATDAADTKAKNVGLFN